MTSASEHDHVLAVDLGTGGPKVALVSAKGELVARESASISTIFTPDGGGEQDPGQWWSSVTSCVRAIVARRLVPIERIVAVSCASQWSVTVPVDEHGRHLMNAIHWTDSRGAPYSKQITDGLIKVSGYGVRRLLKWIRLTGGVPTHSGADALAHILFIKHQRPEIYARCFKLLEPMDYLNFRLTGRAVATYATIYPYLLTDNRDNTHVKYDDGLIAWCGLDRAKLPELAPVGSILGTILPVMAEEWGLSANTQVIAGTPDSQAAALGSGAVRDFAGHVCIGSSDWLSCHVPFKKTNLTNYIATMPSAIHGRNMVMAEQGAAGKCLGIFVDQWLFPKDDLTPAGPPADVYRQLFSLAAAVPAGSEGLLFLPWLNGAGPPSGESAIRGGFLNQSLHTGRAQAVRAIMEGVAFNVRWVQASVERFVGRRFAALNFIGGCARSDLWCQILADVLGVEIRRVANPDMAISRGAAIAALVALKRTTPEEMGDSTPIQDVFSPNPSHRATYAELFGEFVNCYKANRGIFGRLNGK